MNRIEDYGLIGDCHSVALVGKDGSIDWACFPAFDSAAVFCKVLDADTGGHFRLAPSASRGVKRYYEPDTNVLVTRHRCAEAELEVTDCMPTRDFDADDPGAVRSHHAILRRARAVGGSVELELEIVPRFGYGAFTPRFTRTSEQSVEIVGGADALWVTSSHPLQVSRDDATAQITLQAGEEFWVEVSWSPSHEPHRSARAPATSDYQARLQSTLSFWQKWMARSWYRGIYPEKVKRSALVCKALTYAPTGAVVAAPTTSLPEEIGGSRNWDYRFTWIRDATLTLTSLTVLGYRAEAERFKLWLERTGAGRPEDLQIMYGIRGERFLPEIDLAHLSGHRGSRPVRIGNGAAKQMQLDSYGQILEAAYLFSRIGGELTDSNWQFLAGLVDTVCDRWRFPDHGIWEMRDDPRHFIHSKLNCWVALDRGLRMAKASGMPADQKKWQAQRDALANYLMSEGAPNGWFRQAADNDTPDASTLLVPALGLLPSNHPAVLQTVEVIRRDLERDGLVYRYLSTDGLEGGEGAFLLCSFWLLDCLTCSGNLSAAEELFERLLSFENDVGLYAEEVEPGSGEALGNFPQAFTHMALVASAAHLSAAQQGLIPADRAVSYNELAIERLLSAKTASGSE